MRVVPVANFFIVIVISPVAACVIVTMAMLLVIIASFITVAIVFVVPMTMVLSHSNGREERQGKNYEDTDPQPESSRH